MSDVNPDDPNPENADRPEDQSEDDSGTLADAIAQHLELKRQHGTSDAEVDSERDAALGPARQDAKSAEMSSPPVAPEPETVPDEPASEPERPSEPKASTGDSVEFDFGGEQRSIVDDLPKDSGVAPQAPAPPTTPTPAPQVAQQPAPAPEPQPAPPSEPEPTRAPHPSAADVLEDTPEFFEESPEYDRLWFDEKAPREFEF